MVREVWYERQTLGAKETMSKTEDALTLKVVELGMELARAEGELSSLRNEVEWLRAQLNSAKVPTWPTYKPTYQPILPTYPSPWPNPIYPYITCSIGT